MSKKAAQKSTPQAQKKAPLLTPVTFPKWWLAIALIFTFFIYTTVFKAGFVNWDDDDYVVENFTIRSLHNFHDIITTPVQGNYHPLTMLSLAANYAISGGKAGSYHFVNLLLHLLNMLLVFLFVYRLTGSKPWIAFITALLFGIHPLHVESVAWVSERKDVLYSLFFLAGLIAYLKYIAKQNMANYLLVLGLFVLSLLSKPAAIIFPIVLLAVDYYHDRLNTLKAWYEKIPLFALSVLLGIMTLHAQKLQGAVAGAYLFPHHFRLFFGFYGIMMYLLKSIWPFQLCTFYPFPPLNPTLPFSYYISPIVSLVLAGTIVYYYRRNKLLVFAILFYLINLVMVLQFLPVGSAIIADRYTYLPLIGVFLVPGLFFQQWIDKRKGKTSVGGIAVFGIVAFILGILSFRQAQTWGSSAALWDKAIKIAPSSRAYTNRGLIFKREGNYNAALEMYTEAIHMNKAETDALVNRGNIYFNNKQYDLAITDYNACLKVDSMKQQAIENRGSAYGAIGKYDLALVDMNKAIQMNPDSKNGYANRAVFYQLKGSDREAIRDFNKHLEVNQNRDADILNSIGISYLNLKNYDSALAIFSEAIQQKQLGAFYSNRAMAYFSLGKKAEARSDVAKAESLGFAVNEGFKKTVQ